jgi:orotidine-5'-phosphate decarboxylase
MSQRNFMELVDGMADQDRFVCVGLDSDQRKIPKHLEGKVGDVIFKFNSGIVEATKSIAGAYKPNLAFYIKHGRAGLDALFDTIDYINAVAPDVPVILDAKWADIGDTNLHYVEAAFDWLMADALTINPYLGQVAVQPFLDKKDKGIIVLCRTSNTGADEFQDFQNAEGVKLYQQIARNVAERWNANGNCCLVVGATYPDEAKLIREIASDIPFLMPGVGKQGGDLEKAMRAAINSKRRGVIVNSSSGIIFAGNDVNYVDAAYNAALALHVQITQIISMIPVR